MEVYSQLNCIELDESNAIHSNNVWYLQCENDGIQEIRCES